MRFCFFLLVLGFCASSLHAQTSEDVGIQLTADLSTSPVEVNLSWKAIPGATTYNVYRKLKGAGSWGSIIGSSTSTSYTDNTLTKGINYEYRVVSVGGTNRYGFANVGIEVPEDQLENRGWIYLAVEKSIYDSMATRVDQLKDDLINDGWQVMMKTYFDYETDVSVKADIKSHYLSFPNTRAVFMLGNVWIPYSGDINPDAHANHKGAWPADAFYGDMDGNWTDVSVLDTSASRMANWNVPGDGKWDNSIIPGNVELEVGRVYLGRMPTFADGEHKLTAAYLDRLSDYKNAA